MFARYQLMKQHVMLLRDIFRPWLFYNWMQSSLLLNE